MSIYGPHTIPNKITHEDFTLSFQEFGVNFIYSHEIGQDREEKLILGKKKSIQVNPVAPLTKPMHITPYLLIEFVKPLLIDARVTATMYLKVPVDIGVFLLGRDAHEILDIVSLTKAKYILYGDPRSGLICRYVLSDLHQEIPAVDIFRAGVLELKMTNKTSEWAQISLAVLNAYGMKIYFSDSMISMKAEMEIQSHTSAETRFIDSPLSPEMKKSLELFPEKRHPLATAKFMMREGL